jgi:DNA transformation protein
MADEGLAEWVAEALEPIGTVTHRAMMGGRTLYCDGTIFAIAVRGELWFKSDAVSDAMWDEAGADRFVYSEKDGKPQTMNYRRAPSDVYDDADAMRLWAEPAIAAGRRPKPKPKRKK